MSKSSGDGKQQDVVRALVEVRDYLMFSAEKAEFLDDEDYLAVRNYIQVTLSKIMSNH